MVEKVKNFKTYQATLTNIFKNLWQLSVHSNKKGEAIEYC